MDWTPVLATLGDEAEAEPAGAFPIDATRGGLCGVYSWWADEEARSLIGRILGTDVPALIYIGKAGGETSAQTFLSRIRGKHLRGTTRTSTLRKTLTAILIADEAFASRYPDPRARETKRAVSAWMAEHLRIATVPITGVALVEAAEQAAIARFDPPLNLTHVGRSEIRDRLRALRKALQAATAEATSDEVVG